jgi:branched-chain amino acid transport system substrate-binding protein
MRDSKWQRRTYLKTIGAVTGGGLIAGCTSNEGNGGSDGGGGDGGFDGTIKVGFIAALSGPYARLGQFEQWSAELAQEVINENGGINNHEVELIFRDSELDPSAAVGKANDLIRQDGIDILMGPTASSVALALMPVAARNGILNLAGVTAARQITGADCNKWTYRFRNNPELQALALAPELSDMGFETASIIYADYAWGQSENEWFTRVWEENGGRVLSSVGAPLGTTDYAQYISNIDTSADALFVSLGGNDAINFLQQANNFGLQEDMQLAGLGASIGGNIEAVSEFAEGMIAVNYYPSSLTGDLDFEGNREFHERFMEKSDGDPPTRMSTPNYEFLQAVKVTGDAMGYTGRDDNEAILDELDQLEMERSFEFPQGTKRIRAEDNQAMLPQYMVRIEDGVEQVTSTVPASVAEESEILCNL